MTQNSGRAVTVLLTHDGEPLGTVGPFTVEAPYWNDVAPVTAHLESLLGSPTVVLRLLDVDGGADGRHGHATYHAETLARPVRTDALRGAPDAPWAALAPHAKRADWATPSGLREALDWADTRLRALGRPPVGPVRQVKTWNLAGLVRIPTAGGPAWLKTGPRFALCESVAIGLFASVDAPFAPTVLAADPDRRRVLLDHVPGEDCWGPSAGVVATTVPRLARAQAALSLRHPTAPDGLPDRSPRLLIDQVHRLLDGPSAAELTADELSRAHRAAARLPALVADLEACGLPNTVLHGDFHPGNWRSDSRQTTLVDFADSAFGHPAVDGLRPRPFTGAERWTQAADAWTTAWSELVPGCDPARALTLAQPLVHFGYAVRYQEFLDGIEPSEQRYHAGDPAAEIRAALACD
ncbi:aminoglycoside phosphotransferase family protein [Kitasatospora mediocidica]|uniref:aminoglycoside phosphotransferase family protein n=1 Tax=Kitasatospora mediocidica TaxID=58352 RepID=UPI0007C822D5|nr:aminoglycoside phosphotransferase family protein [Kitasatospora mediocidica]